MRDYFNITYSKWPLGARVSPETFTNSHCLKLRVICLVSMMLHSASPSSVTGSFNWMSSTSGSLQIFGVLEGPKRPSLILRHSSTLKERDAVDLWQLVADKRYWRTRPTVRREDGYILTIVLKKTYVMVCLVWPKQNDWIKWVLLTK